MDEMVEAIGKLDLKHLDDVQILLEKDIPEYYRSRSTLPIFILKEIETTLDGLIDCHSISPYRRPQNQNQPTGTYLYSIGNLCSSFLIGMNFDSKLEELLSVKEQNEIEIEIIFCDVVIYTQTGLNPIHFPFYKDVCKGWGPYMNIHVPLELCERFQTCMDVDITSIYLNSHKYMELLKLSYKNHQNIEEAQQHMKHVLHTTKDAVTAMVATEYK